MCYSAEVSLGTFLFVAAGSAYLWIRARPLDKALALIFLIIALMQLLEFFLWKNLECGPTNQALSKLIPIILMLQPTLTFLVMWQFKAGWAPYYKELFFLFAVGLAPLLYKLYTNVKGCVTLDEHGHLAWPKESYTVGTIVEYIYWFGVAYSYLTLKNPVFGVILTAFHSLSNRSLISMYPKSWPSMYCHFVNIAVVLAIFLN